MNTSLPQKILGPWRYYADLSWAIAREAGASILTYELYPLGIIPSSSLRTPWVRTEKKTLPLLFIHGIFHNPATFTWIKQRLAWAGYRNFHDLNLFASIRSIPENANLIAKKVERLRHKYNVSAVDIVAHSMGGILARYYVQLNKGDGTVRHLITLATPHQGTLLSKYSPLPHLRELTPGSKVMQKLSETHLPKKTFAVAVSGTLDILMQPKECALWPGVRNIVLQNVGHAGLLFSNRVVQILLSHLD